MRPEPALGVLLIEFDLYPVGPREPVSKNRQVTLNLDRPGRVDKELFLSGSATFWPDSRSRRTTFL